MYLFVILVFLYALKKVISYGKLRMQFIGNI